MCSVAVARSPGDETSAVLSVRWLPDVGGAVIDESTVAASIRAYVADEFLLGAGDALAYDTPLVEGGVVDSMGIMEIVDYIEDAFGVQISEQDLVTEHFGSVARMATFVVERLASAERLPGEAAC